MTNPTTPVTSPAPVIDRLRRLLDRGIAMSNGRRLGSQEVRSWIGLVRSTLGVIYRYGPSYGPDQLAGFQQIARDQTAEGIREIMSDRVEHLRRFIEGLDDLLNVTKTPLLGNRVFIGHGRSPLWRELKDLINERLGLPWDEFNREAVAGITTSERLQTMLSEAAFAFLVMTGEEELSDASIHARSNVIHEVGLFQGRLGLRRVAVMLEEGCAAFSNIEGLSQIRFPHGDISARFEEVRRVMEREGLL